MRAEDWFDDDAAAFHSSQATRCGCEEVTVRPASPARLLLDATLGSQWSCCRNPQCIDAMDDEDDTLRRHRRVLGDTPRGPLASVEAAACCNSFHWR